MAIPIDIIDLGRMAYAVALARQRERHALVVAGGADEAVFLVEHDPVITISRRPSAAAHLIASAARLAQLGIDVQATDRGGDITYHGPGQVVMYPILRLSARGLNVGRYMRLLEQVAIDAVATFGVTAQRDPGGAGGAPATGVWVGAAKLCAVGVRVSRGVSLHGLALNVTTDLAHFDTIVPCGLAGRGVTSLRALLGPRCPSLDQAGQALIDALRRRLNSPERAEHSEPSI